MLAIMTLTTTLEILEPHANPERLFAELRRQVGIPSDHPIETWKARMGYDFYPGVTYFLHIPSGYAAKAEMMVRPDPSVGWFEDEDDSGWYIRLSLDTALDGDWGPAEHSRALQAVAEACGVIRYQISPTT